MERLSAYLDQEMLDQSQRNRNAQDDQYERLSMANQIRSNFF
jgi:hypothetical protein